MKETLGGTIHTTHITNNKHTRTSTNFTDLQIMPAEYSDVLFHYLDENKKIVFILNIQYKKKGGS